MLLDENLITLAEAAEHLPRINGRRIHVSSLHRWRVNGIRGIRLETRRLGRRVVTSVEALERFSRALAELDHALDPEEGTSAMSVAPNCRTEAQLASDVARAKKELDQEGIGQRASLESAAEGQNDVWS